MIEKVKAYSVGAQTFSTLEAAQTHAVLELLAECDSKDQQTIGATAAFLVKRKHDLVDILSVKERKAHTPKVVKPRKARGVAALPTGLPAAD